MAMFNNGFPATYQPIYPAYAPVQVQQPQPQGQTAQGGLIWVQGEAGAKSYMVAPNNTVQLWDSEAQVIYLKSADASGMPSMKILDYTIRDSAKKVANTAPVEIDSKLSMYATKEEIKAISDEISTIRSKVDRLTKRKETDNE